MGPFSPNGWEKYIDRKFALDNGAWSCFQKGIPFQEDKFIACIEKYGHQADWIVVPDCVGNKKRTLEMIKRWRPQLGDYRQLIAVQDGMEEKDVSFDLEAGIGIFVGGSTEWKLSKLGYWADVARRWDVVAHCGRVNSMKRIQLCIQNGYTSFDGSGVAKFPPHAKKISSYLKMQDQQLELWR